VPANSVFKSPTTKRENIIANATKTVKMDLEYHNKQCTT
jgi:hypothetical protein